MNRTMYLIHAITVAVFLSGCGQRSHAVSPTVTDVTLCQASIIPTGIGNVQSKSVGISLPAGAEIKRVRKWARDLSGAGSLKFVECNLPNDQCPLAASGYSSCGVIGNDIDGSIRYNCTFN